MLSKARKWSSASIGAPLLGNMEVRFFLGAVLFRGIFMRFSREMHMPCKWVSLHRDPLGEPGGGSFARIFERKEKVCLGSILGPRGR